MNMLDTVRTVVKEPFRVAGGYRDKAAREEFYRFVRDSFLLLNRNNKNQVPKPDLVFDDSHCHFRRAGNCDDLEAVVGAIVMNTDRCAMTERDPMDRQTLTFRNFLDFLRSFYKPEGVEVEVSKDEIVAFVRYEGREAMVYRSQEVCTDSHLHITAEGCTSLLPYGLDPRRTVEMIHADGGIATIEHPCTKSLGKGFILTTEEEDKITMEIMQVADAVEVFNSMNSLYMALSNARTRKLADEFNKSAARKVAEIAVTDNHFGIGAWPFSQLYLRRVGSAGIYLPRRDVKSLSGKEIIQMKKDDLSAGKYERFESYIDPLTFSVEMIPGRIRGLFVNEHRWPDRRKKSARRKF